jgi:hypothetical protein
MPSFAMPKSLAATAFGLTLLAAAAGCSSGGSGGQPSGGSSSPAAAAAPTGITVPRKIDVLTMFGKDVVGMDEDSSVVPKAVSKNLHLVNYYTDPNDGTSPNVEVRGGLGMPIPDGSEDVVRRLFSEWDLSILPNKREKVASGPVGGSAECAPIINNKTAISCGWVNGKMALLLDFNGFSKDKVTALVPKILEAMVTT